jgi:predicted ATPase/class 3 adenylate cyclase
MSATVLTQRARTTLYLVDQADGPVVYKVLQPRATGPRELTAFYNEAEATRALTVSGARGVLRRDQWEGLPALVLPYVDGEALTSWYVRGRSDVAEALHIAVELAGILGRVHAAGLVHRDVKPDNIIYDSVRRKVTLIDFAIASRFDLKANADTRLDRLAGTPAYLAPEQTGRIDRTVDHRADLYAFGATLFHVFTGRPPFTQADPIELIHSHIARRPPRVSELRPVLPEVLADIVARLLEKNAEDRYQTAVGVRADLERCQASWAASGEIARFPLGDADAPGRLLVPERLYGRDAEQAAIGAAFVRAAGGPAEVVRVSGAAGTGKSSLVRTLQPVVAARGGILVEGKGDALQRGTPFSSLRQALAGWLSAALAEPEEGLRRWRDVVAQATDGAAAVLLPIVPNLESLVGPLPAPAPLTDEEAERRFAWVVRRFLRAISRPDRPLVLFFDDLHHAEVATLRVLEDLAADPELQHLLLVVAWRDNEVTPTDPVFGLLERMSRREPPTTDLPLARLGDHALRTLLADTMGRTGPDFDDLVAYIGSRSGSNPFAVRQVLGALDDAGALTYDPKVRGWRWDPARAMALDLPDNVVDLLARRMSRAGDAVRRVLAAGSVVGDRFPVDLVAHVCGQAIHEVAAYLASAVREGLVNPVGDTARLLDADAAALGWAGGSFKFVHDRVREAAGAATSEADRASMHLRIGRWLLGAPDGRFADHRRALPPEALFDVVAHLDAAIPLIDDLALRRRLGELNLEAARLATRSAAHAQALAWLRTGRELLGPVAWASEPELMLAFTTEIAEAAQMTGDADAVAAATKEVEDHARAPIDAVRARLAHIKALVGRNALKQALAAGVSALASLGVRFPRTPTLAHVIAETVRVKIALFGRPIAQLADQAEMTDPRTIAALQVMEKVSPAAFRLNSKLFPLLVLRVVVLTARHGCTPVSSFGYGGYALTLSGVLGDIDGGYAVGQMAKRLADRLGDDRYRGSAASVFEMFVRHWKEPLSASLEPLVDAWRWSASTGRVFEAAWAPCYRALWMEASGAAIGDVAQSVVTWKLALKGDRGAERLAGLLAQVLDNLSGAAADPRVLTGRWYDEGDAGAGDRTEQAFFCAYKLRLAYLFRDAEAALRHARAFDGVREALTSMPMDPIGRWYAALARVRAVREGLAPASELRLARRAAKDLDGWAKHSPANYGHKAALLRAELAELAGDAGAARAAYDLAIQGAREHAYLNEEALALELASDAYARLASPLASVLAELAEASWRRLGALAKVGRGSAGGPSVPSFVTRSQRESEHAATETVTGGIEFDRASLMKAANAIGAEIELDRALGRLVEIVAENAGADHGAVVRVTDRGLVVVAETDVASGVTRVHAPAPLDDDAAVCGLIARRVARTGETALVADVRRDPEVRGDAGLVRRGVRGVLCVPVLHQGAVAWVIYLENRSMAGAFTAQNVDTVGLLASQAAISLENARLYDELRRSLAEQVRLTDAHGRFVPVEFLESIGRRSIVDVQLGDSAQKEMSILYSDIRDFTTLVEGMPPDQNIAFINEFLQFMEPAILHHDGFVDSYIGDAILALFVGAPERALRAAIDMLRALPLVNAQRAARRAVPLRIGIGVNTGTLTLGTIGGHERIKCGVIGDPVNLAARVEGLTKHYGVPLLATGQSIRGLVAPGGFRLRTVDRVRVKGRAEVVDLYEVYDADPDPTVKDAAAGLWGEAWGAYLEGRLESARGAFLAYRAAVPGDHPAALLAERCERRAATFDPATWTGVEDWAQK